MTEIPKLSPRCVICHSENKFLIQKNIDDGIPIAVIAREYDITRSMIETHITNDHRTNLLALGTIDYVVRKKAVDVGITLAEYIEKWSSGVSNRPVESIRDNDAIKAMELFLKAQGTLVNKHEVKVTRDIETALKEFLSEDLDDEEKHSETEKGKDDAVVVSEAAKS